MLEAAVIFFFLHLQMSTYFLNFIFIKRVMSVGTDRAETLEQYSVQPADVSNTPLTTHTPKVRYIVTVNNAFKKYIIQIN